MDGSMNISSLVTALLALGVKINSLAGGYVAIDTWANILANHPATNYHAGAKCLVTDVGPSPGTEMRVSDELLWRSSAFSSPLWSSDVMRGYINFGGSSSTYSQTGTVVTVTQSAGHGLTADFNGDYVYLTQSTGALVTGWFSGFTYISSTTYSCVSTISQSTSGNLGTSTGEVTIPWSYTIPTGFPKAFDVSALQYLHVAKSSANNKTAKHTFNGLAIYTGAGPVLTTSSLTNQVSAGQQIFSSDSTFFTPGVSGVVAQAVGNLTYAITSTLANSADWHRIVPQVVTYSARYNP